MSHREGTAPVNVKHVYGSRFHMQIHDQTNVPAFCVDYNDRLLQSRLFIF